LKRVMAEIAKCDVRCANCHRIKTFENGDHLYRRPSELVDVVEAGEPHRGLFDDE
jgi:hypothetical protein